MAKPDASPIKPLLDPAKSITILLPRNPSYDSVASALSLKLTLDAHGKTAEVVCADPMTVEFSRLVGIDTVGTSLANSNLVISFPGQTENVDKVSYNLDNGELQLVITPKVGAPSLDHRRLKFVPASQLPEVVILVGVNQLQDLGPVYIDAKELFSKVSLISFTRDMPVESFAKHHLYDAESSSISEIVFHILSSLNFNLHPDVATNLLSGLEKATAAFQSPQVTYVTFETAANLIRRGARRHTDTISADNFPTGSIPTQSYTETPAPVVAKPAPQPASPSASGWGTDGTPAATTANPAATPPTDWYEPKIYRGPMLP